MVSYQGKINLLPIIHSASSYHQLVVDLQNGQSLPGLALPRSARLPVVAALYEDLAVPLLLITDRTDHALTLAEELAFWLPNYYRLLFPAPTPLFYEQAIWGSTTRRDRLLALSVLASYLIPGAEKPSVPPIIITSGRALMSRTLPRRDFIKATRTIKPGMVTQPEALLRHWSDIGYQATDVVVETGQFSRRGGILDLWPPSEPYPARVEFFGTEIETLRQFDPATQRTLKSLDVLFVTPGREVLPGRAVDAGLSSQELAEFNLPLVHPAIASLLDYLPQKALILVDDLDFVQSTINEVEEQAVKLREESIKDGLLPSNFPIPYVTWSEIQDNLSGHTTLELGRSTAEISSQLADAFTPGSRFGGRLKPFIEYLADLHMAGDRSVIVSRQVSRLKEVWSERENDLISGTVQPEFVEGTLGEGWTLTLEGQPRLHLLTDSEIFGWERPQARRKQHIAVETPEAAYSDLKPGDWVVHIDHGIGHFIGLVRRFLDGLEREYLAIEYEQGDQLFVPIHQADRLTRYIGPDNQPPSPTRLGSGEWTQTKDHVREAVEEVAIELLDLYSKRQVAKGYSYSADSTWQKELEASFPYFETEDQLRAINEVKQDMENDKPMDRLLCGDVGYGKTEVALRAAFKAVMDGKQVALLVPTTVLAQQHFDTFSQRLSAFPVTVEMLSRFRTPKEQDEILKKLNGGAIDIIIGTHRLLQADVNSRILGW